MAVVAGDGPGHVAFRWRRPRNTRPQVLARTRAAADALLALDRRFPNPALAESARDLACRGRHHEKDRLADGGPNSRNREGYPMAVWRLRNVLLAFTLLVITAPGTSSAGVVVNEIFYNAPQDMDDVQWIEFYNTSDQPADLSGWTLDDGKDYTFPAQTTVAGKGFLVVALNPERFTQIYGGQAIGPLKRPLKRGSERLRLKDGQGKLVDDVRYKDESPWPVSADGYSASLERICPSAGGESAENWAGSPLPATPKPSGTPGRQNACFSPTLPPVVTMDAAPSRSNVSRHCLRWRPRPVRDSGHRGAQTQTRGTG